MFMATTVAQIRPMAGEELSGPALTPVRQRDRRERAIGAR
jgi:hypothetical protein